MITVEELYKLAALAKLSLDGEDIEALRRDISGVLEFADAIAQAEVELTGSGEDDERYFFREDTVRPSFPSGDILSNAGEQRDGYFASAGTSVSRKRGGARR